MKILKYESFGKDTIVSILFDDNTYNVTKILDNTRPKEEILKDAYIILKNTERYPFNGDTKGLEDLILPTPTPTFMEVDFYDFKGKAYDQYGEEIQADITFEIQGTDKARIENNKLVTEEVQAETSFFIVAKCGTLEEKQERTLYPKSEEPAPQPDMTATLVKEVANLKIDSIKDKQINKKLGQEVANLKIKLMKLEGGSK